MAMVEELSGNELDDLQGGKKDTGECRTSEQDDNVVSVAANTMCGDAMRQNNVADAGGAANYANGEVQEARKRGKGRKRAITQGGALMWRPWSTSVMEYTQQWALFLTSDPFFDAPVFKPVPAATSCDIDGKASWLLPTLFDARSKSHGFVTLTEPAPIKKASQDGLASGHGKNAGRRSLTMRVVFLVQAPTSVEQYTRRKSKR
ncbi:hypothetical protein HPB51_004286 [Rhipicephalus microplus]|uniref:Uncharacterized protein n=1 Tax=Rhipicephalus microplus TaxID=6941 RepID=A0A9J6ELN7_RHIMP|nr:hypothetical protein HPB51_004286 [Rhipicephalus microplus]